MSSVLGDVSDWKAKLIALPVALDRSLSGLWLFVRSVDGSDHLSLSQSAPVDLNQTEILSNLNLVVSVRNRLNVVYIRVHRERDFLLLKDVNQIQS